MSPSGDEHRLFDPDVDLVSDAEIAAEAAAAAEGKPQQDLDSARMWLSRVDGLPVRGVKPHSARKSELVSRGIDTVSTAMHKKWFVREHGLEYVELYSGPGRLLDEATARELPGSPLQALAVRNPFTNYVFNDFSPDCAAALKRRTCQHASVEVLCGSANDRGHLDRIAGLLDDNALIVAYLDPARPQDLHWTTVEFLAKRFKYIDLIINLPVNSIVRAIVGAHAGGHTGAGAAGRFLHHDRPYELLRRSRTGKLIMAACIDEVRRHFDEQLRGLGFLPPARRVVEFPPGNPYYDIVMASRHQTGPELWERTNPPPVEAQMSLTDIVDSDVV